MASSQQLILGTGTAVNQYQIQRSLRFNSADSAYLNRTPASAGNLKTWTISLWVKRSALGTTFEPLISNLDSSALNGLYFFFGSADKLKIGDYGASSYTWEIETTQVFRDPSAWYHIVIALDTTQATASNRFKLYVNGSQVTNFGIATYPTQNSNGLFNNTSPVAIGRFGQYTGAYASYYLTNIDFIDGQALTPSSFGETNADTGVWQPKAYSGTYGTNGFQLLFADNSGTTSTTLGKDTSGNGNNWTPNNFSVTAGTGNDSLVDTPTPYGTDTGAGGEVRGNYSTWNPLRNAATLANGNLDISSSSNGVNSFATIGLTSGKWYWEVTATAIANTYYPGIGVDTDLTLAPTSQAGGDAVGYMYLANGQKFNSNAVSSYGNSYTTNDVIGVALDMDAGKIWFSKNGTFQNSGSPTGGTNAAFTGITGTAVPVVISWTGSTCSTNFGQRPFAYTAPSGFKALVTQNLPTPTIGATATTRADDYFNTVLYTGNGSGSNRAITGYDFAPGLIWLKSRSNALNHRLVNSIDGNTKTLASNLSTGEVDASTEFISLDSNGFTVKEGASFSFNTNNYTYVAWGWLSAGSNSTNTAGSITSTVRANTTAGFSVVTYTGTGSSASVGHGLGAAPQMIIVKGKTNSVAWVVYSIGLTAGYEIYLSATNAQAVSSNFGSAPTSTVFNLGTDTNANGNGVNYVAYCWASIAGFSAFGSYTGNGSTDGPFIYTGFRPAMIWTKPSSAIGPWNVLDNKRGPYNVNQPYLQQNSTNAEATVDYVDFLSNGFKIRYNAASPNANGVTVIWCAFAENPFKYSLAR